MEFSASNGGSGGSYEKPKPGTYTGVLIGIADLGTQPGGQYGPKRKIMLRWELHKRKGPQLDSAGNILTITSRYNQSFDVKSSLRPVVEAHTGPIRDGEKTSSKEWLGKSAKLLLKESEDQKYVNVASVTPLDPEEDEVPTQVETIEHWEMSDLTNPPGWAKYAVEQSPEWKESRGVPVGAGTGSAHPDDDIPF